MRRRCKHLLLLLIGVSLALAAAGCPSRISLNQGDADTDGDGDTDSDTDVDTDTSTDTGVAQDSWEFFIRRLRGHARDVSSIAFSPDGLTLASGALDGEVRLWRVADGTPVTSFAGHTENVSGVAFSADGQSLFTAGWDNCVKKWRLDSDPPEAVANRTNHQDWIEALAITADRSRIATCARDGEVLLWGTGSLARQHSASTGRSECHSLAFAPDGAILAAGDAAGRIHLLDGTNLSAIRSFTVHAATVYGLSFAPAGDQLLSGGADNRLKRIRPSDGVELGQLSGPLDIVYGVAVDGKASRVAGVGNEVYLRVWDYDNGALVKKLHGHGNTVRAAAFSPDGSIIATSSYDNTIVLWTTP